MFSDQCQTFKKFTKIERRNIRNMNGNKTLYIRYYDYFKNGKSS